MNPARKRAYIELLIVSLIWGMAAPIIKFTLGGFSPAIFLTYRFFISAVIAIFFFIFFKVKFPKDRKTLIFTIINGFLLTTVGLGLLFLGINKTNSVDSNLISAMAPVTIAIAGVLFLKERVTKRESIGLLIALAGTFITIIEPVFKNGGSFAGLEGNLLVFASVIAATITAVFSKKILRSGVDAATVTNISFIVGFLSLAPFVLPQIITSKFQILTSVPLSYHLGVFYMAILSGTFAYILWHRAEKSIEVSEVGLFAYLYPIFGMPLSIFWLNEKITLPITIGFVIIALGVFLAEFKKRRYN
jgi:drug/metabolite transporter (DMT)-like permease